MRLATLAALKADLGITDSSQDAALGAALDQASAAAERYCRRRFGVAEYQQHITYHWRQASEPIGVILRAYPVTSLTAATRNGDALDVLRIEVDNEVGLAFWLDERGNRCAFATGQYRLNFKAGYNLPEGEEDDEAQPLPDDLQRGVLLLAASVWYGRARDPSIRIEDVPDVAAITYGTAAMGDADLPGHVTAWLDPYRAVYT